MASMREHLAALIPTDYDRERSRLCKRRSTCQSWWLRYTVTPTMTTVAMHRPTRPSRGVRHTKRRLNGPSAVTASTNDPHRPIVPLKKAALAVAAVAAVAVSRIERMRAAPAMLGRAHEAYPAAGSQISLNLDA